MGRAHRFFTPSAGAEAGIVLDPAESHRLRRVLRLRPGAEVEVFDGAGRAFSARFAGVESDGRCRLERGAPVPAREAATRLTLAVAIPKGDAFTALCRQLSEIGAATVVPLLTERSEGAAAPARLVRWRAAALAGTRQSGRARIADIRPAQPFAEWVAEDGGGGAPRGRRWIAEPARNDGSAWPPNNSLGRDRAGGVEVSPNAVVAAVGPEGGFTPEEIAGAHRRGFERLDLGERILRTPTAAAITAYLLLRGPSEAGGPDRSGGPPEPTVPGGLRQ